mgnify:CR=1 FL=1
MEDRKSLVIELTSVDALAAPSVGLGEITSLCHEAGDDAVEDAVFEMKILAGSSFSLFTRA